jgi:hypothetical protein
VIYLPSLIGLGGLVGMVPASLSLASIGGNVHSINKKETLEHRLMDVLDQYRSMIIDPVEQELGNSPNWQYLRSRLLKALGDRGLAGRIREVLNIEFEIVGDSNGK